MLGFRELYAWQAWHEERKVWSTVIRLDLVRSVVKILDVLDDAPDTPHHLRSLLFRLSPLRRVQLDLEKHLGLAEGEEMCATSIPKLVEQKQLRNPDLEEVVRLIIMCRDDIVALWKDDDVHAKRRTYGIRLDEHCML